MMNSEGFNLAWSNFEKCTANVFAKLHTDEEFTDVTLVCEGDKQIKAHKAILSNCSPFFKLILSKNPHQHPLIYLRGISHLTLTSVIKFMYVGQVEVPQKIFNDFLCVAREFDIDGFSKEIDSTMSLRNENIKDTKEIQESEFEYKNFEIKNVSIEENDPSIKGEKETENEIEIDNEKSEKVSYSALIKEIAPTSPNANTRNKFQCKLCEKQYSDPSPLHRHIKAVHEGLRYKCDFCERVFNQKSNLTAHTKSKHTL